MICLGVSPKKIKSNLKGDKFCRGNRGTEVDYSRNDFIQLKSLRERKRKLLLSTNSLVLDDAQSTLLLVDNLKAEKFDPVLIFKPMGIPDPDLDLDENIFMIGIQTLEQLKMMELCGRDILVIDATHDMTQYGCQLLNIMGVDEFNKGYPLAHCVSNKMDASTLQHFFRAIKLKCPTLQINCIITDDDPALINAANMGFGLGQIKHILCLWHFKRTLQRNLHAKVRNSSLEKDMFHHLCTIVDSEKEVEFHALVNDFQKKYENTADTKTFIEYFNKLCMSRVEKWAMYERKFPHKNVETTMYVVSFHNILKSIYLKRKPNKRIDTLVKLLLEVEEDAYARRTINNVRNEREVLVDLITASHLNAMEISEENMTNIVANIHWRVKSESLDIEYDVQRYATSSKYVEYVKQDEIEDLLLNDDVDDEDADPDFRIERVQWESSFELSEEEEEEEEEDSNQYRHVPIPPAVNSEESGNQTGRIQDNQTGHTQDNQTGHIQDNQTGNTLDNQTGHIQDNQTGHTQDNQTGHIQDNQTGNTQDNQTGHIQDNQTGRTQDNQTGHTQDNQTGHTQDNQTGHIQDNQTDHTQDNQTGHTQDNQTDHTQDNQTGRTQDNQTGHTQDNQTDHTQVNETGHTQDQCKSKSCIEEIFAACIHCSTLLCYGHFDLMEECRNHTEENTECESKSCTEEIFAACIHCSALLCFDHFDRVEDCGNHRIQLLHENQSPKQNPTAEDFQLDGSGREEPRPKRRRVNQQKENKKQRDLGLGHRETNKRHNLKAPRFMKPKCTGKECMRTGKSCNNFSDSIRNEIFSNYWEIGNLSLQREFITRHVRSKDKKRAYTANETSRRKNTNEYALPLNSRLEPVCKVMFLNTLGISETTMRTSLKNLETGVVNTERRGGRSTKRSENDLAETEKIINHINKFDRVESHYTRANSSREYLHADLNIKKMFRMYQDECLPDQQISSLSKYRKTFWKMNLSFHHPKKDLCSLCTSYREAADDATKKRLMERYNAHIAEKAKVREKKRTYKLLAKENRKIVSAVFDLQQVIYIPKSNDGQIFYKRRLANYNFTIYNLATRNCNCYVWYEAKTKTFIEYFNKLCMSRVEKWAMYERKFPHKNVETTMYVVSFHNILKSIYLKRKPNKRIDTLVKLLLEVEEDAYARRTINNVRNEREVLVDLITASHLNAMEISEENMTNIVANIHWRVKSESLDIEYDVQRYATS
ncbi:hypothetical protein WDU94_001813 [Cyamophila willieti]